MQIGELGLELHVIVAGAGDVARAAGAGTDGIDRLVHGGDHGRVLPHAEVVVGAPDGDGTRLPVALEVLGGGERTSVTLQVGKDAVPAFLADGFQRVPELACILHRASLTPQPALFY